MKLKHQFLPHRLPNYLKKALFAFSGLLVALLLCELLLAIFIPQKTFNKIYKDANRCWVGETDMLFSLKPNCSYALKNEDFSVRVNINGQGMRGAEAVLPKPENTVRLIVTGDSFIFGNGLKEENTFPNLLGDALGKYRIFGEKTVEVINAGYGGGFSPDAHLIYLRKLIARGYQPDIVIMSVFVGNDFFDMADNVWIGSADFSSPKGVKSAKFLVTKDGLLINTASDRSGVWGNSFLRNSHLAVFLNKNLEPVFQKFGQRFFGNKPDVIFSEPTDSDYSAAHAYKCIFGDQCHRKTGNLFGDLLAVIKAAQSAVDAVSTIEPNFLVLLIPADFQVQRGYADKYGKSVDNFAKAVDEPDPQPQKRIRELLIREGIPYLDLLPGLRRNSQNALYFVNDGHLNELGAQVAADEARQWIARNTY